MAWFSLVSCLSSFVLPVFLLLYIALLSVLYITLAGYLAYGVYLFKLNVIVNTCVPTCLSLASVSLLDYLV